MPYQGRLPYTYKSPYNYTLDQGTQTVPSLAFLGDTNNGLFSPATDNVAITTNGSEKLRVTSDGNVGIGTTNPGYRLHVHSNQNNIAYPFSLENTAISGSTLGVGLLFRAYNGSAIANLGSIIVTGSTWTYSNYLPNQLSILGTGSGGTRIGSGNAPIVFHTGNADPDLSVERVRITSTGNVGIGTTNPGTKLDVDGAITSRLTGASGGFRLHTNSGIVASDNVVRFFTGQGNGFNFNSNTTGDSTSPLMAITLAGNVGIGTTNPTEKLHVYSSGAVASVNIDSSNSGSTVYYCLNGVRQYTTEYVPASNFYSIGRSGVAYDFNLKNGNVGIGTTNPIYKLDVNGPIRYTNGQINSTFTCERTFDTVAIDAFPNGVADQAFDVRFGNISMWGYIEIEINGTFANSNTPGILRKVFAIGTNPTNLIYANQSRVAEAMGPIVDNISIGEFSWDATNTTYRVPISHIISAGNHYVVKIKAFSYGNAQAIYDNLSLSSVYTLSALPANSVSYPFRPILIGTQTVTGTASQPLQVTGGAYVSGNVGIGTTNPSEKLEVTGKVRIFDGGYPYIDIGITTSNYFRIIHDNPNDRLFIGKNNNPSLVITGGNNVEPGADATQNLGSSTKRWANIYSADLQLSNEGSQNDVDGTWGQYTIQEGENDLFLLNRRNGKKYKFVLQEVN